MPDVGQINLVQVCVEIPKKMDLRLFKNWWTERAGGRDQRQLLISRLKESGAQAAAAANLRPGC